MSAPLPADEEDNKKTMGLNKFLPGDFQGNSKNLATWGGFASVSLIIYYFLSSGDFSFLLTYAACLRCFGFGLLNFKVWSTKSAKGVSVKSLQIYSLVFFFRLLSILRHQGYLPFDKTGDWFYHFVEIMSMVSVVLLIYGIFGPLVSTYNEKHDKFGAYNIPAEFGALFAIVPCIIIAVIFHPSLNREWLSDTSWTLSMYLEAVAILPQIYMFQKQAADEGGTVETLIGHTVFAVGFARVFELIFWLGSFKELADHSGSRLPGYIVLISQLAHLVIMADFFYYWFKSISKGVPMELPQTYSSVV